MAGTVRYTPGMAETATAKLDIDASVEDIFEIIMDLESYPEWISGMQSVEVLERDGDDYPYRAAMVLETLVKTLSYTLVYDLTPPSTIKWKSEPGGDVKLIDGIYDLTVNDDGSTHVRYELTVDPGFRVPGFLLRKANEHVMRTALSGLKERAEA